MLEVESWTLEVACSYSPSISPGLRPGFPQMKPKKRNIAHEIFADLKEMHATLRAGTPLREKYVQSFRLLAEHQYVARGSRLEELLTKVSQL